MKVEGQRSGSGSEVEGRRSEVRDRRKKQNPEYNDNNAFPHLHGIETMNCGRCASRKNDSTGSGSFYAFLFNHRAAFRDAG